MAAKLKRSHKFWKQKNSDIEEGTNSAGIAHSNFSYLLLLLLLFFLLLLYNAVPNNPSWILTHTKYHQLRGYLGCSLAWPWISTSTVRTKGKQLKTLEKDICQTLNENDRVVF